MQSSYKLACLLLYYLGIVMLLYLALRRGVRYTGYALKDGGFVASIQQWINK